MANYDIGGNQVVGGGPAYPDGGTLGYHESVNGWSLGSKIDFGAPGETDFISAATAGGYYASADVTPTDCLWVLTGEGDTGTCYLGMQFYYVWMDVPTIGQTWVCTSIYFISSDQDNLEGHYTSIGSWSCPIEYNFVGGGGGLWFQAYNEVYEEHGHRVSRPYLGLGGRQQFGSHPMTYDGCLEHIAGNPEDYATFGSLPLKTPSGEWIDKDMEPDESEPGGGDGDWDNGSDVIPWPDLPTLGSANCGFLTVYNPSRLQMKQFGEYLWSDFDSVFNNISKYQSNMLDLIVSLMVVPVAPVIGEAIPLKIGGKSVGISMNPILGQYMIFDCGTLNVREYWGSSLDYGPYTKLHLVLPGCGCRELKTDEVMDGSVSVRYHIDLVTGCCVALVRCARHGLDAVLYQHEGNIAMSIPLVSRDFMPMYSRLAKTVSSGLSGAGSGGAVGAAGGLADAAINVMTMKPNVQRASSLSSNSMFLGVKTPYIVIERPIQDFPKNANQFYGYPSNIRATLSSLKGYTECEAEILNIPCTVEEGNEIRRLLREGVIL